MQDTAEGFGQPIRQIFEPFFRLQRELPTPFDAEHRFIGLPSLTPSGTGCTLPLARDHRASGAA
jgi:hypothetical protein